MKRTFSLVLAAALAAGTLILPASAAGRTFVDVPANHWAAESIRYAVDKGYFSGTGGDTFSPDGTMTRAMLWMVLSRMDNHTGTAAPGAPWYQAGRDWAMTHGISDGTNPDGAITREQFAAMLRNFAKHTGASTDANASVLEKFVDRGSISSYAVDSIAWAVAHGIVSGTSGSTISPSGLATRSQAAAMLMRFDQIEGKAAGTTQPAAYETRFTAINVPPYPGDTIDVGSTAYVAIFSRPYGENVKAGVTYTVTASDPTAVSIHEALLSQNDVCYGVTGLKAGTVTLTAVGSDGFTGTTVITVRGGTEQPGTGTGGTEKPVVDIGEYAGLKAEVVQLINQERTKAGLHTLAVSDKVMQAAQIRAQECATWEFSHTRPNGTSFNTVFMDVALPSGGNEIIAVSDSGSVRSVVEAWVNSPGHHKAMVDIECSYIGVGISCGADGALYYSAMFTPVGA